jgi:hypothetical protein
MKQMTEILEKIDGHTVIRGFEECPVDPEATKAAVENEIKNNPALAEAGLESLFETYVVSATNISGRKLISETEYAIHKAKFDALGEHEWLAEDLEIVHDYRNSEYWRKANGRWGKSKIERLGETAPADAVLPDALTEAQSAEIAAQNEADRIAALTGEAKEAEKQTRLDAAADEADRLSRRAEIQGKSFDITAWYAERRDEIEAKYA